MSQRERTYWPMIVGLILASPCFVVGAWYLVLYFLWSPLLFLLFVLALTAVWIIFESLRGPQSPDVVEPPSPPPKQETARDDPQLSFEWKRQQ